MNPHYVRIAPRDPLPNISSHAPFSAVIIIRTEYPAEWRSDVNRQLLRSGCRYVMTWGPGCEAWHDDVDRVNIDDHAFGEIPDDKFVMTTWHEDETLEATFWYAQFCGNFSYDDVELTQTVLLDITPVSREREMLALWEQSKTLAERDEDQS